MPQPTLHQSEEVCKGVVNGCSTTTVRVRVEGGWVYQTFFLGGNVAVHSVFVPDIAKVYAGS